MERDRAEAQGMLEQVFLMERDTGVLCRVLGLYAARGIDVAYMGYEHAAVETMLLRVRAAADANTLRILVEKAGAMIGVIEATVREGAKNTVSAAEKLESRRRIACFGG